MMINNFLLLRRNIITKTKTQCSNIADGHHRLFTRLTYILLSIKTIRCLSYHKLIATYKNHSKSLDLNGRFRRRLYHHLCLALCLTICLSSCKDKNQVVQGHTVSPNHYILAQASGRLLSQPVHIGETVKTGALLYELEIEPDQFMVSQAKLAEKTQQFLLKNMKTGYRPEYLETIKAKIAAAQASSQLAEEQYQRFKSLRKSQSIAVTTWDMIKNLQQSSLAALSSAQYQLQFSQLPAREHQLNFQQALLQQSHLIAQLQAWLLSKKTGKATFSGVINLIYQHPGQMVTILDPILSMIDPKPKYIIFLATPLILSHVHLNQTIQFRCQQCRHWHHGHIVSIADHPEFTPDLFYDSSNYQNLKFQVKCVANDQSLAQNQNNQAMNIKF